MTKLICTATCYMPISASKPMPVERYEDYYGDARDVYEVEENRADEFLATGNFKKA